MFLSQIEKKMPGTTRGVVEPAPKKRPEPRIVQDWKPSPPAQREVMPDPELELELPSLDIVDDRPKLDPKKVELEARVDALLNGKRTRTCGVELPLDVHACIKAEALRRKVAFKKVALEYILAEHNRRQMR